MLKMRLQRIGRKNDASFRLIITDSRRGPKSGKHIDLLGSYNPKMNEFTVDAEKAREWIKKGVQVSDTVHNLLVTKKVIEGKKINVLPRKTPIVSEEAKAEKVEETKATEAPADEAPQEEVKTEVAEDTPTDAVAEEEKGEEPKEESVEAPKNTNEEASSEPDEDKKAA